MNKGTLYLYGALLSGVLTVSTFAYSNILVPVWKWITAPSVIKTTPTTPANSYNYPNQKATKDIQPEKAAKSPNCGRIISQLQAGKAVNLPAECEESYKAFQERQQARRQEQADKETAKQAELDRQSAERQNQQRLNADQQARNEQQQREEQQRREYQARQDRENQEREARRKEEQAEADRQQARRDAEQREQNRQRQQQQRNDAIIKLGTDLKKIFKKP